MATEERTCSRLNAYDGTVGVRFAAGRQSGDPTVPAFATEMEIPSMDNAGDRFIVWAEATDHDKPLIMTDLPPARLFDDIVVPYQTDGTFFIDGAPVKAKDLRRIKILRAKPDLNAELYVFRDGLTSGNVPRQKNLR